MLLSSITYKEFAGHDQEWVLDRLTLGRRNLLVGKNATGKSRCLNVIGGLAKILSAQMSPAMLSADYTACFQSSDGALTYSYRSEDEVILEERFSVNGKVLLDRGAGGVGSIFASELGAEIKFQAPQKELAAVVRRDGIQHPFLQPLFDWGSSVRHYHFGTPLGKDRFAVLVPKDVAQLPDPDDKDASEVVGVFKKAGKEVGEEVFKDAVLRDLARIDYAADDVGIGRPVSVRFQSNLPGEIVGLWVKEKGLRGVTDQHVMSQGMFRVFSLLTLTNYLLLTKKAGCIIIDDIGEGLDFERSCLLIDLLREKAEAASIQLIAATNDKFVMNRVPLEEWSVLQRRGSHLKALNKDNSRNLFEEFRFTGLSNFSFLEMDFANAARAAGAGACTHE